MNVQAVWRAAGEDRTAEASMLTMSSTVRPAPLSREFPEHFASHAEVEAGVTMMLFSKVHGGLFDSGIHSGLSTSTWLERAF